MQQLTNYVQSIYNGHIDNCIVHRIVAHVVSDMHDECTIFGPNCKLFSTEDDVLSTLVLLQTVLSEPAIQNAQNVDIRNATFLHMLKAHANSSYYAHLCAYVAVAIEVINDSYNTRYCLA